jgi:hypothetical protein
MTIMHAMDTQVLPRWASASLQRRLRVMPAVVVTGHVKAGGSTLTGPLAPGCSCTPGARRRGLTVAVVAAPWWRVS